ncbi:TPA: hypothetical protein ACSKR0_002846 [Listeria monocytogenes]
MLYIILAVLLIGVAIFCMHVLEKRRLNKDIWEIVRKYILPEANIEVKNLQFLKVRNNGMAPNYFVTVKFCEEIDGEQEEKVESYDVFLEEIQEIRIERKKEHRVQRLERKNRKKL